MTRARYRGLRNDDRDSAGVVGFTGSATPAFGKGSASVDCTVASTR
jgi:hypothetical protein